MNLIEEGIHSALVDIGLPTAREIFEYMHDRSLLANRPSSEKQIIEFLQRTRICYYRFSNRFVRRRYTLSYTPNIGCILPRIFYWDLDQETLHMECKETIKLARKRNLKTSEGDLTLLPDNRRTVVFCIKSSRYLDGIVDFRLKAHERSRMPSIIYRTESYPQGASELYVASRMFYDNQSIRSLMIRGTDR